MSLLHRFSLIALLATIVFGFTFGKFLGNTMEQNMLTESIQETADIVVQNVVKHFKAADLTDPKTGRAHYKFTHRMDHLSLGMNIRRVRIWNRDMIIVWDRDKELLGNRADEEEQQELKKAFQGSVAYELSDFRSAHKAGYADLQSGNVLELYVPIEFEKGKPIETVFEVYEDLDAVVAEIHHHKKVVWLWTVVGFSSLYVVLFGGFWDASRRIKKQTREILRSKQEWEHTFNTIPDMVTVHDKNFNIVRANSAAREVLQLPSLEVNKTVKCYEYYHGKDSKPEKCPGYECMVSGHIETMDMFEPGLKRFLEIRAVPRFDEADQFEGIIHVVRDITGIKEAEEKNRKLQEQFLQVQKMDSIGRLAGGVAHDFNNILSVIIGFSELSLRELTDDHPLKDNITAIHGAAERAAGLTKKLLAFSRKQVLEMTNIRLNSVIENMSKMLGRLIGEDVALQVSCDESTKVIHADPVQVEQVLLNLAVNARDAMPGGGRLSIKTRSEEVRQRRVFGNETIEPDHYAVLSVTDTGEGMTEEIMANIFEPFFSTKPKGKGTGMGLATVYGVVKQHKGYIVVESEPDKGSTFNVFFPAVEGEIAETDQKTGATVMSGSETILVVDDEPQILTVVTRMLESFGYRTVKASSGDDALQTSDGFSGVIDLLLTDVIMPGMNGRQLADQLLIKRPGLRVMFMSGYTDDTIAKHGILGKSEILLNKPITEKVLARKVREVLDVQGEEKDKGPVSSDLTGMRILVAEDNRDIRQLITMFLNNERCELDMAENGEVAVSMFMKGDYNVVLMDMQMPVMDGFTAAMEIRRGENERGGQQTPIIAMTGYDTQETIEKCMQSGCSGHLAKPLKRETLITAIASLRGQNAHPVNTAVAPHDEPLIAHVDTDLRELVPEFLDERQDDIQKIAQALETGDFETIRILGHSMKGSGGGFGFQEITDIGRSLEGAAEKMDSEEIRELLIRLAGYIESVKVVYV